MKMLHILLADCFGHSVQLSLIILLDTLKLFPLQYLTSEWLKEINEYPTSLSMHLFRDFVHHSHIFNYNLEQI